MTKRKSLSARITVFAMPLILLFGIIITVFGHFVYRNSVLTYQAHRVENIAAAVAATLDAERFVASFSADEPDEYHAYVYAMVNNIFNSVEGMAYIYVIVPAGGGLFSYFVSTAIPEGFMILEEDPYLYAYEAMDAFRGGRITSTGIIDAGEWGILVAAYAPIFDARGNVLGLVGADIYSESVVEASTRFTVTLAVFVLAGVFIIGLITYLRIRSITAKRLNNLMTLVGDVAAGRLDITRQPIVNDEIGMLTTDMYNLADEISSIVNELSQINHEFHTKGDIDFRADSKKHQNSFRDVTESVNSVLENQVKDTLSILNALNSLADGDFDVTVIELPGKKNVLSQTLIKMTKNLKDIHETTIKLAENASIGRFDETADVSKFGGGWAELAETLNHLTASVAKPLNEIRNVMARMGQNLFDTQIEGGYKGDFLEVKNDINNVISGLRRYIQDIDQCLNALAGGKLDSNIHLGFSGEFVRIEESIKNINSSLSTTMAEILSAADHVLDGAQTITSSANELAEGSSAQAASLEELNTSVELIKRQTAEFANNAREANELSGKSTASARQGSEAMGQMLEAMNKIADSSNSISKVNKVIQDIAFQTNLLALNAAVEAARAGEHGKGFAVVAEEVRSLAARSQEAASETTELINDSINRVESGTNVAHTTAGSLDAIVSGAKALLALIDNITTAANEQADMMAQISTVLLDTANIVQDNSKFAQESAATAQELSSQSKVLREMVGYFKLG